MSNDLELTVREGASGRLAMINGKTYALLRLYQHRRLGGIFCLIVAGKTRLRADDLAEHWRVFRHGSVYLAVKCRPFSYHLIQGRGSQTDAPRWPGLKSPPTRYAFVGPNEESVKTQIRLTLERYRSSLDPGRAIEMALRVDDLCGGPPAYVVRGELL